MRSNRIRYTLGEGEICLFVTLTYSNLFVPYVDLNGIKMSNAHYSHAYYNIPVRRLCDGRWNSLGRGFHCSRFEATGSKEPLDYYDVPICFFRSDFNLKENSYAFRPLKNFSKRNCYGVCYYPDLQNFYKRLRINLSRIYNYNDKFKAFSCSEYGSTTHRPHFHLLLFIPKEAQSIFRSAIVKSWPYCDYSVLDRYIEIARDAAGYVSSYVNGHSHLPALLSKSLGRTRHSYSQDFGMSCEAFNLEKILEGIDKCSLQFDSTTIREGRTEFVRVSIPYYVINRYFPKFKGHSRITDDTLYQYLHYIADPGSSGLQYARYRSEIDQPIYEPNNLFKHLGNGYYIPRFAVTFQNAYKRFHALTGMNIHDYIHWYIRAWRAYAASCLKHSFDDVKEVSDLIDHYDDVGYGRAFHNLIMDTHLPESAFDNNPNNRLHRRITTYKMTEKYYRMTKQKCITNLAMSEQGHYV